jgi:hypothetical protein
MIAGKASVFRSASLSVAPAAHSVLLPPDIPQLFSYPHVHLPFSAAQKQKRHSPGKGHASFFASYQL